MYNYVLTCGYHFHVKGTATAERIWPSVQITVVTHGFVSPKTLVAKVPRSRVDGVSFGTDASATLSAMYMYELLFWVMVVREGAGWKMWW